MASKSLRLFISSPGDVALERSRAAKVLDKLQLEYRGRITLQPFFWEHEPMRATASFSDPQNIPLTSEFDVVVCILWSRLGSMLSDQFRRPDGSRYPSGTVFELEVARESYLRRKAPDLLVYRRDSEIGISNTDTRSREEKLSQLESLEAFIQEWFFDRDDTFRSALNSFKSTTQFETLLEKHLRVLIEQRIGDAQDERAGESMDREVEFASYHGGNPFRGLKPFEYEDRDLFFGRSQVVEQCIDLMRERTLQERPMMLIHGMSGCGKSSLARAGVLPVLMEPGVIEGMAAWRRAEVRMGEGSGDPLMELAEALVQESALPELGAVGVGVEELHRYIREGQTEKLIGSVERGLQQAATSVQAAEGLPDLPRCGLVLLLDQFEAVFADSLRCDAGARALFEQALLAMARSGSVWVVLTMRSDQLGELAGLEDLSAMLGEDGQVLLTPPTETDLSLMIRLPAKAAGVVFEQHPDTGERLEDRLLKEARHAPDGLPLVGFVLQALFERKDEEATVLTHEALDSLNGLEGAVAAHAEETHARFLDKIPDGAKADQALRSLARALTNVSDNPEDSPLRRVADLDALRARSEVAGQLADDLIAARLLATGSGDQGKPVVHVAHEALLRKWPRLSAIIEEERPFLSCRHRAELASSQWRARGRKSELLWDRGALLADAKSLEGQSDEMADDVREFVSASVRASSRRSTRAVAAVVLVLAALAGAWFLIPREQVTTLSPEEEARLAKLEQAKKVEELEQQLEVAMEVLGGSDESSTDDDEVSGPSFPHLEVQEICQRIRKLDPDHEKIYAAEVEADIRAAARLDGDAADELYGQIDKKLEEWVSRGQPRDELLNLRARIAWQKGDQSTAAILWSDYLRTDSIEEEEKQKVFARVTKILESLEKWTELRGLLDEWISWGDNPVARVRRARIGLTELRLDAVKVDVEKARELNPQLEELVEFLPGYERVMALREQLDDASRTIESKGRRATVEDYAQRVRILLEAGQPAPALEDLEMASRVAPKGARGVAILRAMTQARMGRPASDGSNVESMNNWSNSLPGFVSYLDGFWPDLETIMDFDNRIGEEPGKLDTYHDRGWALWRNGFVKMAMMDAEHLLEAEPGHPALLKLRAACFVSQRKFAEALSDVAGGLERAPDDWDLHRFCAEAQHGLGENEAALISINRAIQGNANWYYLWSIKGRVLRSLNRGEEAAEAERRAAELRS